MQGSNHLILLILFAIIFGLTGFNFGDFGLEENKEQYILLVMALILTVIYLTQRSKLSKE